MLNNKEEHFFQDYLTRNRSIRILKQNKVGYHDPLMGFNSYTQRTFLYKAVNIYNSLPKNITLIRHQHLLKKWVKRYNLDRNIKLKDQIDYDENVNIQQVDQQIIIECQEEFNDILIYLIN